MILVISLSSVVYAKTENYEVNQAYPPRAKGLIKREENIGHLRSAHRSTGNLAPGFVDLSQKVSLPEDQGQCGCCWDFALTKALRSEYMLAGFDPGVLEFNFLLNNCGKGPHQWGCNGGDFNAAESFVGGDGPGLNALNPFNAAAGASCPKQPMKATSVTYLLKANPTFQDIAQFVGEENHILVVDVDAASGDWEHYSGGIYDGCATNETPGATDHMLNLIGYNCESSVDSSGNCVFDGHGVPINKDGYLLLMNQWGESWGTRATNGHRGYMKTRMYAQDGSHCNNVATDVLYFNVNPSNPPTPVIAVPKASTTCLNCSVM